MSGEEFTIEKLKLNERLQNVEIQMARLVAHMESERGTMERIEKHNSDMFDRMMQLLNRHDELFFGDNDPGMLTRFDRLEQSEENRKWHLRIIWAALISMASKVLYDIFTHRP